MEIEDRRLKMAVIAGAANALRFKDKKPRATEQEVIQHLTENIDEIIQKIDEEN